MLLQFGGTALDGMLRLGVMCSLPFDWCARRRVESHVNFFILNALPVPAVVLSDSRARRVAELAAQLACLDGRFADLAKECGVSVGSLRETQRAEAIAEIDALVASIYGLETGDFETIFADFTVDAVPESRRQAVRNYFAGAKVAPS